MALAGRNKFWSSLRRRLGVMVALSAYLTAAIGFPLPSVPLNRKTDTSQPYPCQDHACGCQSAEECWTSCCCFTPEERWAWAAAHNVQPPEYAEKPAATGWRTARLRDQEEEKVSQTTCCCCGHDSSEAESCCSEDDHDPTTTCPVCKHTEPESNPVSSPVSNDQSSVRWVLGVSALRCKGLSMLWVGGGVVLPLPVFSGFLEDVLAGLLIYSDWTANRIVRTPPSPPPRSHFG